MIINKKTLYTFKSKDYNSLDKIKVVIDNHLGSIIDQAFREESNPIRLRLLLLEKLHKNKDEIIFLLQAKKEIINLLDDSFDDRL